jgi:hypothetical protein
MDKQDPEKGAASAATVTPPAATGTTTTPSSEPAQAPSEPAAAASAAAKVEPASAETSRSAQVNASSDLTSAPTADGVASDTTPWSGMSPGNRITLLAASLVLAAVLGAAAGAFAGYRYAPSAPAPAPAPGTSNLAEIQALKENVVQARVELAALKVSVDVGNRNASTGFTRTGERIERLERLVRDAGTQTEVTGSANTPNGPGAADRPGGPDRWVVRDVRRGAALIEGRMGLIEVVRGDVIPGLGRVAAIGKQDGRWVVVTSRGLITSTR